MSVRQKFEERFAEDNLKQVFNENVALSGATGIDNLTPGSFLPHLNEQCKILSRKALSSKYSFTKYKLKLVTKGRGKAPREISIPTVRDRIALRGLNDFLSSVFAKSLKFELPQNVISEVKKTNTSGTYDGFIKLDVCNFYPSIKHDELELRLRKRIKDSGIMSLIRSAITTPTVTSPSKLDELGKKGVPQGLAVSNVLAAIYMINIDRALSKLPGIKYFRYVDDVLIFCKHSDAEDIANYVSGKFQKVGLVVHKPSPESDKSVIAKIGHPFSYLGYYFKGSLVTAKQGTVERLKNSLAAIFTAHKHSKIKNEEFLLWRLDMRITGCIFENKSKGWLCFFAEINDEKLLHQLDHYVKKLAMRFGITKKPKRFSRAYKELTHNRYQTRYIPNFDEFELNDKLELLNKYFPQDLKDKTLTPGQIDYHFKKRIRKQTKDLLEDIKDVKS